MSWHTFLSLVVFAAFLPSIISEAFPPIPTDPAIRLQTLPRVFDISIYLFSVYIIEISKFNTFLSIFYFKTLKFAEMWNNLIS